MFTNRRAAILVCLLPLPALASSLPFINEIHYDNTGGDAGEGVEIAGRAGVSLDGWTLLFYNGGTGAAYRAVVLSGTLGDQSGGFGTLFFEAAGLQNGAPDGLALIDAQGTVQQFLSYEGSFVAVDGAAAGLSSIDIGVFEPADTPLGWSLQLAGTGTGYDDFEWSAPTPASFGTINAGQQFAVVPAPAALLLFGGSLVSLAGFRRAATRPGRRPSGRGRRSRPNC